MAEMATPDLGGSRTVVATPWSDPLHRPRLVCYSGHAGETSREHRLREVIWDLSDPSVANGTLTRRLHTDTDTHVVVNPLLVARQSLVADLLAVIAPRSALAATALRRCRHGLARWLLDDPDSKASDGDDVVRRFVTAGVPATSVALVPASDVVPRRPRPGAPQRFGPRACGRIMGPSCRPWMAPAPLHGEQQARPARDRGAAPA